MGVTKKVLKTGNGVDRPSKGDEVVMNYRGCLYDPGAATTNYMGRQYVPPIYLYILMLVCLAP